MPSVGKSSSLATQGANFRNIRGNGQNNQHTSRHHAIGNNSRRSHTTATLDKGAHMLCENPIWKSVQDV